MSMFTPVHKYQLVEGHRIAYLDEGHRPPVGLARRTGIVAVWIEPGMTAMHAVSTREYARAEE